MIPEGKFKDYLRYVRRVLSKRTLFPGVGRVDLGGLDRVTPVSENWGYVFVLYGLAPVMRRLEHELLTYSFTKA